MAEHPDVPPAVTTAAIAASPGLQRFYLAGGGSPDDLRTDLSHALAAAAWAAAPPWDGPERRRVIDLRTCVTVDT